VRYGSDFDTDPETSWAGKILRDESFTGTENMNQINDYELFVLTGINDGGIQAGNRTFESGSQCCAKIPLIHKPPFYIFNSPKSEFLSHSSKCLPT
jgi:hypothetical protein